MPPGKCIRKEFRMKQTEGFLLQYIEGIPYLLPFGQRIAEHRRTMRLNETSAFIWKILPECSTARSLHEKMTAQWEADTPEEQNMLWQDLQQILQQFDAFGLLDHADDTAMEPSSGQYRIAGIRLQLQGAPEHLQTLFASYEDTGREPSDLTIRIHCSSALSTAPLGGEQVLYDPDLHIVRQKDGTLIHFPSLPHIVEVRTDPEETSADIFCMPPWEDQLSAELFPVIRLLFSRYAQTQGMLFLHSASLFYQGKAWLFSGSSGTGKSTHTNLWHKLFGTPVLNGDLNLLAVKDGKPLLYGTPWCGTSGISDSGSYPLGGIVLLKQDTSEHLDILSPDEQLLGLLRRIISPSETASALCQNMEILRQICEGIPVWRLHCTKNPDAALYIKEKIDAFLQDRKG